MILNLEVLWSGERDVPIERLREWRSMMSGGCSWRQREMRAVAVQNMLRRALFLMETKWMALYSRLEQGDVFVKTMPRTEWGGRSGGRWVNGWC